MQDAAPQALRQSDMMDPAPRRGLSGGVWLAGARGGGRRVCLRFSTSSISGTRSRPRRWAGTGIRRWAGSFPTSGCRAGCGPGGAWPSSAPCGPGLPPSGSPFWRRPSARRAAAGRWGLSPCAHEFWQEGALCLTDWQRLVYREDPDLGAPRPVAPEARRDEETCETRSFDATLLFRYSALTFQRASHPLRRGLCPRGRRP